MSIKIKDRIELTKFLVQKTKDRIEDPLTSTVAWAKEMEEDRLKGYEELLEQLERENVQKH